MTFEEFVENLQDSPRMCAGRVRIWDDGLKAWVEPETFAVVKAVAGGSLMVKVDVGKGAAQ